MLSSLAGGALAAPPRRSDTGREICGAAFGGRRRASGRPERAGHCGTVIRPGLEIRRSGAGSEEKTGCGTERKGRSGRAR